MFVTPRVISINHSSQSMNKIQANTVLFQDNYYDSIANKDSDIYRFSELCNQLLNNGKE